jgi:hypothetical protein
MVFFLQWQILHNLVDEKIKPEVLSPIKFTKKNNDSD